MYSRMGTPQLVVMAKMLSMARVRKSTTDFPIPPCSISVVRDTEEYIYALPEPLSPAEPTTLPTMEYTTPLVMIMGRKKIARYSVRPRNFWTRTTAIKRLSTVQMATCCSMDSVTVHRFVRKELS